MCCSDRRQQRVLRHHICVSALPTHVSGGASQVLACVMMIAMGLTLTPLALESAPQPCLSSSFKALSCPCSAATTSTWLRSPSPCRNSVDAEMSHRPVGQAGG
eukprot:3621841-Rhodomonas_salina.4